MNGNLDTVNLPPTPPSFPRFSPIHSSNAASNTPHDHSSNRIEENFSSSSNYMAATGTPNSRVTTGKWERVEAANGSLVPCQRSLHAGTVWKHYFVVFGGYDGHLRVNDLHSFNFKTDTWQILTSPNAPSPRDRHVAVVYDDNLYIFGGFDGTMRVNDLHAFDFERNKWRELNDFIGNAPSPRHSHATVVYGTSMYVFGGYDGSYKSDFHQFNFANNKWTPIIAHGEAPRARYRGTCVMSGDLMILFGGHDGHRHLQDTHIYDFCTMTWCTLNTQGPIPDPRDSHVAVIYDKSMFIYGGSTGNAVEDFHELKLEFRRIWSTVVSRTGEEGSDTSSLQYLTGAPTWGQSRGGVEPEGLTTLTSHTTQHNDSSRSFTFGGMHASATVNTTSGGRTVTAYSGDGRNQSNSEAGEPLSSSPSSSSSSSSSAASLSERVDPGARFCHVGVVYGSSFYVFGGYDGQNRLNDFLRFQFDELQPEGLEASAPSTIISDFKGFVNNEVLSDIQFIVEGRAIYAHKILCLRCPYFRNLLTGEYMESRMSEIVLRDVCYSTFLQLLEYLYTDHVNIGPAMDTAMDLFEAADRFGIDRLKKLCEQEMLAAINTNTVARILFTADERNADHLRERSMQYILTHFNEVSRTQGFEEMGRTNVDLVFEILKRR